MRETDKGAQPPPTTDVVWRKSRHSAPGGNCVELAALPDGGFAVRNSRHPGGPALVCTREEMAEFLRGAKAGDFDEVAEGGQPP
jgi:hypothetical protein